MDEESKYPLLNGIDDSSKLRALAPEQLPDLAKELRAFLLESVARTGGHLAASLGTVELTIALHYVLQTPYDRLLWDVGHQCYPHKILTGRKEGMKSLRQKDGMSGFPLRLESPYDPFGVGHSSTAISGALGMAIAARLQQQQKHVVAVIGDGGMTAGMAFEAVNHLGDDGADMLIVLNDNRMSISPNVGSLNRYLTQLLSTPLYYNAREEGKRILSRIPPVWKFARRAEEYARSMVAPGSFFEALGLRYYGPVDGHDLGSLINILQNLRQHRGARLLHVITQKGKGYREAENNPLAYHGVPPFDARTGIKIEPSPSSSPVSYTALFSDWIVTMGERHPELVAITPAMREGSGLVEFARRFPQRFFDVGIAEQHALTLAAGMAADGLRPVVAIYSTFLQRAYDQLIHDVVLQKLPVMLAIDRAGLVGADGATHMGAFDLSYLRCLPNLLLMTPADQQECWQMLTTAYLHQGPAAVRYPRASAGGRLRRHTTALPIGRGRWIKKGRHTAVLNFGSMLESVLEAAAEEAVSVADMRFVKPLDEALIQRLAKQHRRFVTVEESSVIGGAGSAVCECLQQQELLLPVQRLGIPDRFIEHGSRIDNLQDCQLDVAAIRQAIRRQ